MKFSPGTGLDVMLCGGWGGGNQAVLLGEKEENATFLCGSEALGHLDLDKSKPQSKKVRKGGVHMKNMWDIRWRNRSPRQEADAAG